MMKKRYVVKLSLKERAELEGLVKRDKVAAFRRRDAEVLLLVDEGEGGPKLSDAAAAERTRFSRRAVEQIRERCVCESLTAALERKKRGRDRPRKLDGEDEARLVVLACNEAPAGHALWSFHLLADKLVQLEVVDLISHE